MTNWNNTGAGNDNWDTGTGAGADDWNQPAGDNFDNNFTTDNNTGGFDDGFGSSSAIDAGGPTDDSCRNCGQDGHFARDCTEPRKMGACFNCGEEGHSKADCTKPRVFTGECRTCGEKGHRASDCPTKPKYCNICRQSDHDAADCKNKYVIDMNDLPDLVEAACWARIKTASDDVDMDDFKFALRCLQKSCPEMTYPALEKQLRKRKNKFYIIALDKDVGGGYTNVNLQGEINKKYTVAIYKSDKVPRPIMASKWPKDPEENLARLADAGVTLERGVEHCNNCDQFGHSRRNCDQDRVENERVKIICALCGAEGHRVRNCTEERQKPREARNCRICDSAEHIAKDCDQKRKMECHNCGGEHMAKDCDQPRRLICNNCDKEGHISKDCDQPRDWSRVTCRHCGEKGHGSATKCKPGAVKKDDGNGDENSKPTGFGNDFDTESNDASGGNGFAGFTETKETNETNSGDGGGGGNTWGNSTTGDYDWNAGAAAPMTSGW